MPRRISKVVLYICNACHAVFNGGRDAKSHWRHAHGAARKARPRRS